MARPLRIEYPDAVYHVSNYGLDNQRVFPSARYFDAFLEALGETCSRLNVEVHAFCLLRNQYHLVIKPLKRIFPDSCAKLMACTHSNIRE